MFRPHTLLALAVLVPAGALMAQDSPLRPRQVPPAGPGLPTPNHLPHGSRAPVTSTGSRSRLRHPGGTGRRQADRDRVRTVTYRNLGPDRLDCLWLQLDQNMRAKDSDPQRCFGHAGRQPLHRGAAAHARRVRRRLPDRLGHRPQRQGASLHHQQDHAAHRPAPHPDAGPGSPIQRSPGGIR